MPIRNFWQQSVCLPSPHWQTHAYLSVCPQLPATRDRQKLHFSFKYSACVCFQSKAICSVWGLTACSRVALFFIGLKNSNSRMQREDGGEFQTGRERSHGIPESRILCSMCSLSLCHSLSLPQLGVWCSDENYIGILSDAFCMHCIMQQMRIGASTLN